MAPTNCYQNRNSFVQKGWLIKHRIQPYHQSLQKRPSHFINMTLKHDQTSSVAMVVGPPS